MRGALALLPLLAACHHFPRVPVTRTATGGQALSLSHTRVCAGESDPILVSLRPDSAASMWALSNENGDTLRSGTVGPGFTLETQDLIESRYQLSVKLDDDNSLTANFEVFRCAN